MSARYVFHSRWQLAASADDVYAALQDVASYPDWWPQVRDVRRIDDDSAQLRCRSRLPYDLEFAIRREIEDPVGRVLRARQSGDLDGTSQWSVIADAGGAVAVFDEDVVVHKALVRRIGLLARPALRLNHDLMMRDGERGLRGRLQRR